MKRLSLVLMSVALVLGMAQCKKNVETVSEGIGNQNFTDGEIRLMVNDGKLAVFPATGAVYYTAGDVIYVASGGTYRGTMTYTVSDDGGYFSGTLTSTPSNGATLYFYYLGGKTPSESVGAGTLTVNISDQTTNYPVIAYGEATEKYGTTSTYHATLKNVGALVKFDVTSSSTKAATCITGMKNKVSFTSLSGSAPTYSVDGTGVISLPAGSGERWAVLLPQSAVVAGQAYTEDSHYYGTRGAVPAIKANDYLSNGISVSISVANTTLGMLNGVFSVSATETVHFSKGNLQYQPSTATWRFAENQYDYIGNVTANKTPSSTMSGWMDLFGWGTSGAGTCYPYTSGNDNTKYAYPGEQTDIAGTEYDWGVNYISNGSSDRTWRTLSHSEWNYILNTRTGGTAGDTENARFVKAQINTDGTAVSGLIIFPDGFNQTSVDGVSWGRINDADNNYTTTVTTAGWTTLESLGCVFLTTGGRRNASTVVNYGSVCYYWSTTASGRNNAMGLHLYSTNLLFTAFSRYYGHSVRLVCE